MRQSGDFANSLVRFISLSALVCGSALAAGPETQRCLTREQLLIEPIFSQCPDLVDEASVTKAVQALHAVFW